MKVLAVILAVFALTSAAPQFGLHHQHNHHQPNFGLDGLIPSFSGSHANAASSSFSGGLFGGSNSFAAANSASFSLGR